MNPYAFTNLINPTTPTDWRVKEKYAHNVGFDYSLSRVFFRAVDTLERVRFYHRGGHH